MLNFNDLIYTRPDMEKTQLQFDEMLTKFNEAQTVEEQHGIIGKIYEIRSEVETMHELAFIRFKMDTRDGFYAEENEYADNTKPIYEGMVSDFYKALLNSRFRQQLEERLGKQIFTIADLKSKLFSLEIVPELQMENTLISRYTKIKSSGNIKFDGKSRSLYEMYTLMQSRDRTMRKRAYDAYFKFFQDNEEKFNEVFNELVRVRHSMSRKLGFNNFVEMCYARMLRSDYNAEMVASYRNQILKHIVPVVTRLRQQQAKRLGLDKLMCYDEDILFDKGNAIPKGNPESFIEMSKIMYEELSPETNEFFSFMSKYDLMDLESRVGKVNNGYCTHLPKFKAPFIFSNFNGTANDINTLTHEAGHAFQKFCSRDYEVIEYLYPTKETSEIYSMAMELFTWPWMDLFFKEDGQKYRYLNLAEALMRIPYTAVGDEFQEWVYKNPEASPAERKKIWMELEKKYMPHRDYDDNGFLNDGGYWYRQMHFFSHPFYFIDYSIAQICAIQFWVKFNENKEKVMSDYIALCRASGSKSFLQLLDMANLKSPFDDGGVEWVIKPVEEWLSNVDDSNF